MAARIYPADAVSGAPSYTGRYLRQTAVAPFVTMGSSSRPLGGVSGVRPGTAGIVSATSTTWTVTPFAGTIDGEAAAIAGPYSYAFDTNQTGGVTAAGGSPRVDRLDVQVSDPAEADGSSTPGVAIVYTVGGPGLQAAPPRSHPLAQINVPATGGGSPSVTWTAAYTSAGGPVQFPSYTALTAWTPAAPNQRAVVSGDGTTLNNGEYVWSGSQWIGGGATITSFGTNWSAVTGFEPYVMANGQQVFLYGAAKIGNSGSGSYDSIITIPARFQPASTGNRFVGTTTNSSGVVMELYLTAGVIRSAGGSGYTTGSAGFNANLPLHCSWWMN